jgi:hypothetical protein
MAAKDEKTPAPKALKIIPYTPEQLRGWTDEQLKTVLVRARERGVADMVALMEAEIANRPLFNAGKARPRRADGAEGPSLETQIARRIADLAHDIAKTFDLSEGTAAKLSEGVKGFKAHKALGSDGMAKTGGLKKGGAAQIARMTSYRVKDEIVSFSAILLKGAKPEMLRFVVRAPKARLPRGVPLADAWPELAAVDDAKALAQSHFVVCEDFEEAASHYRAMIAHLAPARG